MVLEKNKQSSGWQPFANDDGSASSLPTDKIQEQSFGEVVGFFKTADASPEKLKALRANLDALGPEAVKNASDIVLGGLETKSAVSAEITIVFGSSDAPSSSISSTLLSAPADEFTLSGEDIASSTNEDSSAPSEPLPLGAEKTQESITSTSDGAPPTIILPPPQGDSTATVALATAVTKEVVQQDLHAKKETAQLEEKKTRVRDPPANRSDEGYGGRNRN